MNIKGGNISLNGEIDAPGDKSISHRAIMLGAISEGKTVIYNFLLGDDCINTINCFKDMGVNIEVDNTKVVIEGVGLNGLKKPVKELYVGNSGTTIRIISGILSGLDFKSTITGDKSIQKRPMKRIIEPLSQMGANIKGKNGEYPPLIITPSEKIQPITYYQKIASAQVKSSIMFLSLYTKGETRIVQPIKSRDHTEKMMKYFGVNVKEEENSVIIDSKEKPIGKEIFVPGDISSIAFFMVGALILKDSHVIIRNVGFNVTRIGIIDVLKDMGGNIKTYNFREVNNEPLVDIEVKTTKLKGVDIEGDIIPRLIDEIPIIAVAAACAEGITVIKNAEELKVKESNRLKAMVDNLSSMGVDIMETKDGMIINGTTELKASKIETYTDHRIAMSMIIAGLKAEGVTEIDDISSIKTSYPDFFKTLNELIN
ncbi:3-phosphoshikimate 1-carboxyvinyltransferase [Clostridium sp. D2Q-11]|uniref:3-phosphoshikimate 1-carboxyvinyltransferase n=1 Tax=Anaeromonas frigoriresistens TaxID=2683708 RepID=A0A942ZAD1_9FIRM|nr:3-phosphoshikimate 1-carboxyvinyltransferase [Anaeromonas frigoriresistens]MBS4540114.1 3-phosphoshikimate 1-carboxyvinyltransferase [Anaeromonas frigoriresistens]